MSKYDYSLIADEDTRQYLELKEKYNRLEKEYRKLQVEHSRLLFDMDAVIEHEVDVKCKKIIEENKKLKEYNGELIENHKKDIAILCEENKNLKEKLSEITMVADDEKQSIEHILELEEEIKKLKETIKDHQLYEEKLEHRIIEFEELLHGE